MKLLASDFDNTLYFKDTFKEHDLIAIDKFRKAGNLFGVCSGNYFNRIKNCCENKVENDFYITSTGSLIYYNSKILFEKPMSYQSVKSLFHTYDEMCKIWIHADFDLYVTKKSVFAFSQKNIISTPEEVENTSLRGISLGFTNPEEAKIHAEIIKETYSDIEVFQNNECLDIVSKGCTKGNAIKTFTELVTVDKTYGIGDNFNDLPLLETVDVSFTFPFAPKEVQDVCTHIVDSIAEAIDIILSEDNETLKK